MAVPNKRLQSKKAFGKTDHSDVLAGNLAQWSFFLLPEDGRIVMTEPKNKGGCFHANWDCVKHFRIINKICREMWSDVFQARLYFIYGSRLAKLREAIPQDSIMFYRLKGRDTLNQILCNESGRACMVTIPWQVFLHFEITRPAAGF